MACERSHVIRALTAAKSMEKDNELIVIRKTCDLILCSCTHTAQFSLAILASSWSSGSSATSTSYWRR